MGDYESLIEDISGIIEQLNALRDTAFIHYSRLVDDIVTDQITSIKDIDKVMDGLCDFCDEDRFLKIYKTACKHIYFNHPELVGDYVNMYRAIWDTNDSDEEI
jgi:hypothetical protein